jgi:hypothetical protein
VWNTAAEETDSRKWASESQALCDSSVYSCSKEWIAKRSGDAANRSLGQRKA